MDAFQAYRNISEEQWPKHTMYSSLPFLLRNEACSHLNKATSQEAHGMFTRRRVSGRNRHNAVFLSEPAGLLALSSSLTKLPCVLEGISFWILLRISLYGRTWFLVQDINFQVIVGALYRPEIHNTQFDEFLMPSIFKIMPKANAFVTVASISGSLYFFVMKLEEGQGGRNPWYVHQWHLQVILGNTDYSIFNRSYILLPSLFSLYVRSVV